MEPEIHRLDREAMLADRLAAAERVRREVDDAVAAAVKKRRAFFDRFVDHIRVENRAQVERDRLWAGMQTAFASSRIAVDGPASPASPSTGTGTSRPDQWEDVEVEPLPFARAVGEG